MANTKLALGDIVAFMARCWCLGDGISILVTNTTHSTLPNPHHLLNFFLFFILCTQLLRPLFISIITAYECVTKLLRMY
jgi:hypothetical protein